MTLPYLIIQSCEHSPVDSRKVVSFPINMKPEQFTKRASKQLKHLHPTKKKPQHQTNIPINFAFATA
jgi:hypothetical protein